MIDNQKEGDSMANFGYGIGYELEAYQMSLLKVKSLMDNAELQRKKVGKTLNYQKYNILDETDVTKQQETIIGGEIISPILYDEDSLKESISYVLDILKKTNACNIEASKSSAGLHFHFGLEALKNEYQYYYKLIKFMSAFSGEIYHYSHSPLEGLRISIHEYATPYPKAMLDHLFKVYNHFKNLDDNTYESRTVNPLLLFFSKSHMFRFTEETLEFRTCNCPLIPCDNFDVQASYFQFLEYFSFYQKLIKYITSLDFDAELINYYYEKERNNPYNLDKERHEVIKKILKLEK